MIFTTQQLAAYCMLLVQGPGKEVFAAKDPGEIRAAFHERHLLHLEIGGLDFTPELINLQALIQPYVREGVIPPYERMSTFGFLGEYMHWFWTTITKLGEADYFSQSPGTHPLEFLKGISRDAVNEGWLVGFIDGQLNKLYHNNLRRREAVAKVLNIIPNTSPVFPYLQHFKKEVS